MASERSRGPTTRKGGKTIMRRTHLVVALAVVVMMTAILVGCPKKQPAPAAGPEAAGPPGSVGVTPGAAVPAAKTPEAPPGAATGAPAAVGLPSVTLTADNVKRWIASTQDKKVKAILDKMKPEEKPGAGLGNVKKAIEAAAKSSELDAAVKAHGFKDAQEWAAVMVKVMAGLVPATMKMTEGMAGSLDKKSPQYKQMKAEMDKQIAQSKATFGELGPDEQKVVEAAFAELAKAMGEPGAAKGGAGH